MQHKYTLNYGNLTGSLTVVVHLDYYADANAQSAWYSCDLPPYDLTDPTLTTTQMLADIAVRDRQVRDAYNAAGNITSAIGDLLGQRQNI